MTELRAKRFRHLANLATNLRVEAERIEDACATYLRYEGQGRAVVERQTAREEALFAISRANRYVTKLMEQRKIVEGRPKK